MKTDMAHHSQEKQRPVIFSQHHNGVGTFTLKTLDPGDDGERLHGWFVQDYARFWNMGHLGQQEVIAFYETLQNSGHAEAYMGYLDDQPAFIMESYDPAHDQVGKHYDVEVGDWGMHFMVAPPRKLISGFTLAIIRTVLAYHFSNPAITRLVVEPDVRNEKVHKLNRKVGFTYAGTIELEEKTAALAFVTRDAFHHTIAQEENA